MIVFTIRVQTGVVIEEIAFRRDIQVPPRRIFTPGRQAEDYGVPVLGLAVVAEPAQGGALADRLRDRSQHLDPES